MLRVLSVEGEVWRVEAGELSRLEVGVKVESLQSPVWSASETADTEEQSEQSDRTMGTYIFGNEVPNR